MSTPPSQSQLPATVVAALEELCFRGVRSALNRDLGIADLCERHPEHAQAIRSWLGAIEGLGDGSLIEEARQVGPYRLVSRLGQGGFGDVYLAEQEQPVRRRVALKVLKLGMDSTAVLQRFAREQDALARMNHDAIARIFDAGTTPSGQPFFAMELVEGVPIVDYCERERLALRDRLALFVAVCLGVHHAHQKGVVHRDLKPSNVLVARVGERHQPKLIDFGIARALEGDTACPSLTETGTLLGTPAYMAPEQARGDLAAIDTRTDVYALGAILFELLTGEPPFVGNGKVVDSPWDLRQRILDAETPRPSARRRATTTQASTWQRQLRGELDWIVPKAMAKQPEQRYASAAELADDVGRFLRQDPVLAGPPSASYRIKKFLRRHRAFVVGSALVLATALIGSGIALRFAYEAGEQAIAATEAQNAERARAAALQRVTDFQGNLLKNLDLQGAGVRLRSALVAAAGRRGDEMLALLHRLDLTEQLRGLFDREVLEAAETALHDQLRDAGEPRISLFQTLADTATSLGSLERAQRLQQAAIDALDDIGDRVERRMAHRAVMRGKLAVLMSRRGFHAEAVAVAKELADEFPDGSREALKRRRGLATALITAGRLDEAESILRATAAALEATGWPEDPDLLLTLSAHAVLLNKQARHEEAEVMQRRIVSAREATLGAADPQTLVAVSNLAVTLWSLRRYAEAEAKMRAVLAERRRTQGEGHPDTVLAMSNLGTLLCDLEHYQQANELLADALKKRIELFGEGHPDTEETRIHLAASCRAAGDTRAADQLLSAALQASMERLGPASGTTRASLAALVKVRIQQGELEQAVALLEPVLAGVRFPPEVGEQASWALWVEMAALRQAQGRFDEAGPLWRELLAGHSAAFGRLHPQSIDLCDRLTRFLLDRREFAEATAVRRSLLADCREKLGDEHRDTLSVWNSLGFVLQAAGDFSAAESEFRLVHAHMARAFGAEDSQTLVALGNVAFAVKRQGRLGDAEPIYREALAASRRSLGPAHPTTAMQLNNLVALLSDAGRTKDACDVLQESHASQVADIGTDAPAALRTAVLLGRMRLRAGEQDMAYDLLAPVEGALRVRLGDTLDAVTRAQGLLVLGEAIRACRRTSEFARAEAALRDAHAGFVSSRGGEPLGARKAAKVLSQLFIDWHVVEPTAGHDAKAAEWRARSESSNGR